MPFAISSIVITLIKTSSTGYSETICFTSGLPFGFCSSDKTHVSNDEYHCSSKNREETEAKTPLKGFVWIVYDLRSMRLLTKACLTVNHTNALITNTVLAQNPLFRNNSDLTEMGKPLPKKVGEENYNVCNCYFNVLDDALKKKLNALSVGVTLHGYNKMLCYKI